MIIKAYKSKVEDVDNKGRVIVAANALGNVDNQKDMSMEGSFTKTLNENFKRVRWFLNHIKDQLLGVPIKGVERFPHLIIEGQLNLNKSISRDIYEDYKLYAEYGKSLEHSIGAIPIKTIQKGDVRQVTEWQLWEYSTLTAWGANEEAVTLGIKSDIDFLNIQLQKGRYTDERFKQIEAKLSELNKLLTNEPPNGTQGSEPIDLINTLKQFTLTI